jgi:hypothetical protein
MFLHACPILRVYKLCEISFLMIILIGILGNATNVLILTQKSLRKSFSFQLYLYLSLIDLAFLAQTAAELALNHIFKIDMRTSSWIFCKLNTFLSYFLMQTRNVFTMCITMSYLFEISKINSNQNTTDTTKYSDSIHKSESISYLSKVRKILYVIIFLLILVNFHYILFLNINTNVDPSVQKNYLNDLTLRPKNESDQEVEYTMIVHFECSPYQSQLYVNFLATIWIWIDTAIYFLIPSTVNLVSFLFIFFYIKRFKQSYSNLLYIENYKPNTRVFLKRMRKNRRIIWRLFSINTYFFLSTMPSYVSTYLLFSNRIHLYFNYLGYALFYGINSLNFLFYGLTSHTYRAELIKILRYRSCIDLGFDVGQKKMLRKNGQLKEIDLLKNKCEHFEKLLEQKNQELIELKSILGNRSSKTALNEDFGITKWVFS